MKFLLCFLSSTVFTAVVGLVFKIVIAYFDKGFDSQAFEACVMGFRFDLAIAAAINLPIILLAYLSYRIFRLKSLNLCWLAFPCIALVIVQLCDTLYALNAQKHITDEASQFTDQFVTLTEVAFTEDTYLVLGILLFSLLSILIIKRCKISLPPASFLNAELSLVILIAFEIIAFRSYFTGTPLRPSSVYQLANTKYSFYAMNGAYSTIYHLFKNKNVAQIYKSMPSPNLAEYKSIDNKQKAIETPKYNVVLFLLESWPAKYSNSTITKNNVTPFLDNIAKEGLSSFAMIADGKRTHEGLFAALCSAYNPLGEGLARNNLNSFNYHCLPEILGMHSIMFQGTSSDMVGDLALQLGMNESYGKFEIEDITLPFNKWGVQDEDLFKFIIKKAKKETKPFFYVVNNTTTHDITLPQGVEFKFGNSTEEKIEKSLLHHVDKLLGDFYKKFNAEVKTPTIFIFTGDHTRFKKNFDLEEYSVPFIMVANDHSIKPKYLDNFTSQTDIAPTLVDIFNGYVPWFQGFSLLKKESASESRRFFKEGQLEVVNGRNLIVSSIYDPQKLNCYFISLNRKETPTEMPCIPSNKLIMNDMMIKTWVSQDLLFNGKTKEFRPIQKK